MIFESVYAERFPDLPRPCCNYLVQDWVVPQEPEKAMKFPAQEPEKAMRFVVQEPEEAMMFVVQEPEKGIKFVVEEPGKEMKFVVQELYRKGNEFVVQELI